MSMSMTLELEVEVEDDDKLLCAGGTHVYLIMWAAMPLIAPALRKALPLPSLAPCSLNTLQLNVHCIVHCIVLCSFKLPRL